jgi:hypothetical protein
VCHRSPRWSHLVFRVMEPEAAVRPIRILYEEAKRVERSGGARESTGGSQRFFFRMGCSGLVARAAGGGSSLRTFGLSLARYDSPSTIRSQAAFLKRSTALCASRTSSKVASYSTVS